MPGHERFVPNMLAGVGPVPAVLIVVAADEGWMPQSAEHLAALHALDVRHGLLVGHPQRPGRPGAGAAPRRRPRSPPPRWRGRGGRGQRGAPAPGSTDLRAALDRLVARLPARRTRAAPVRLWIDRSFTIRGGGTVVTGTLGAGALRAADELELALGPGRCGSAACRSLGAAADRSAAVAPGRGQPARRRQDEVRRGAALLTPGAFRTELLVDVRVHGDPVADLPADLTLHIGSAAVPVRVRPLGADTARLRLARPLPLRIGDRALLRDPGRHHVAGGVTVLDVGPAAAAPAGRGGRAGGRSWPPWTASRPGRRAATAGAVRAATTCARWACRTPRRRWWPATGSSTRCSGLRRARAGAEVAEHAAAHPLEPGCRSRRPGSGSGCRTPAW